MSDNNLSRDPQGNNQNQPTNNAFSLKNGNLMYTDPQTPDLPVRYQFSPEEMCVIKEVSNEALLYRSLPYGIGAGWITYLAVAKGYLKSNARWGSLPKVCAAATIGYFIGKYSYVNVVADRLMELPNSKFGAALRLRKANEEGRSFYDNFTPDPNIGAAYSLAPYQPTGDDRQSGTLNLDTERPTYSGLDDTYRPNLDGPSFDNKLDEELNLNTPKVGTTYEELRRKNRETYYGKKTIPQNPSQPSPPSNTTNDDVSPVLNPPRARQIPTASGGTAKNKYGDSWE